MKRLPSKLQNLKVEKKCFNNFRYIPVHIRMKASEMKAKFLIEVPSPVQTLLFFLFRSKAFSEYKRILCGAFSSL